MTALYELGPTGQGIATAALAANVCVKWDTTPGNIVVCGVGDIPIGVTQDAYAAGAMATFIRWGPGFEAYVVCPGVTAGDYVKCGASGALAQEATASTVTVATVGQAKTTTDAAGLISVSGNR